MGAANVSGRVAEILGKPVLSKWWVLNVTGPLPARAGGYGEFVMDISFYGDPPGWWITAE